MSRLTQLDGLRGLAATVVVIHHCFLVAPVFGQQDSAEPPDTNEWTWWVEYTPLHLFWNGGAAVLVFFVLSGFVLAIPFLNPSRDITWLHYYPRRLVRLYVPVWGAVIFAVVMILLIPRKGDSTQSWWINRHDVPLALKPVLADLVLIRGTSWYNSPLWSLQYEVIFSLFLPLVLVLTIKLRRVALALALALLVLIQIGESWGIRSLQYLPVFVIGVLLAVRRDLLDTLARRAPRDVWVVVLLLAGLLISAGAMPVRLPAHFALTVIGCAILVVVFYCWSAARRLGDARPVQWLGKRSFSLYLTHEPVIVSIAVLTGWSNPFGVLAVALPASLAVGAVFYRVVEAPSHRASRSVGRSVASSVSRCKRLPGQTGPHRIGDGIARWRTRVPITKDRG